MNPFTNEWLTTTCAPESITNIKDTGKAYLDTITNENKTIKVFVLSGNKFVFGIGFTCQAVLDSPQYTFKEALHKVAELLQLQSISTK